MATWATLKSAFPPAPLWTEKDVPDLSGKVMIVTGANAGIGKETARVLLAHGAKVYLLCRSSEKSTKAVEELKLATGKGDADVVLVPLDLGDLASVKAAADAFLAQETRLDALFNNAGVMFPPISSFTKHGHDLQFGTNVLGHFYLTQLLLPILLESAKSSSDGKVRVINVSSSAHMGAPSPKYGGPVVYETVFDGPKRNNLGTETLYFQSKAGNILFSHALERKYRDQGIVSIALHPGVIASDLQRHWRGLRQLATKPLLHPASLGALSSLYAGTSAKALEYGGKYLQPWARLGENRIDCDDVSKQDELWAWLEGEVVKHGPASGSDS